MEKPTQPLLRSRVTILEPPPCYLDRDFYGPKWLNEVRRWWEERWR